MLRRVVPLIALLVLSILAAPAATAAPTADPVASAYQPVAPVRVLDTRAGLGAPQATLGAGQSVTLDLSSRVPAGATAVVLNVTATSPSVSTFVTVWPADSARPVASNLNVAAGETRPNLTTVRLGQNRRVSLFNGNGTVHLLADLAGYYTSGTGSLYQPFPARRVLDTRDGTGVGAPNQDGSRPLNLTGAVPAEATAVTFNLTATNVTTSTYVTAWPHGGARPVVSNLNLVPGDTRANLVTVALGADRTVDLFTQQGTADLIADLAGFYVPGEGIAFYPIDPVRIADTRTAAPVQSDNPLSLILGPGFDSRIPANASAVTLNMTATLASTATYVSVVPGSATIVDPSSTVNITPGATVPNQAAVVVGMNGSLVLRPGAGTAHLIVDLAGYFAPVPSTCAPGCVYAWGQNNRGMLGAGGGTGDNAWYGDATAAPVSGLGGVTAVAARYALRTDGTVWAWGENFLGELGAGWHVWGSYAPVPVRVRGLTNVTAIAGSQQNGYALRSNGTVWGWGQNFQNQVGWQTNVVDTPVQITGVSNVVAIATSQGTAYALRSDGTVWAWGSNFSGELGNGTTGADSPTPVQVTGLTGVTALAAADDSRYALRSDGTVWTWGSNAEGQLGDPALFGGERATAAPVPGLTGVRSVGAASRTGFAVLADKTVVAWGSHFHGEAGVGGADDRYVSTPTPVVGLTNVTSVVGNGGNGYALLADGSVWGWGVNVWYELGIRNLGESDMPLRVPGVPPATAIAATGTSAYALIG